MRVKNGYRNLLTNFRGKKIKNDWNNHPPSFSGEKKTPTSQNPILRGHWVKSEVPFRSHEGAKKGVQNEGSTSNYWVVHFLNFSWNSHLSNIKCHIFHTYMSWKLFRWSFRRIPKKNPPKTQLNSSEVQVQPLTPQVATPVLPAAQRSSANWKMWVSSICRYLVRPFLLELSINPLQGFLLWILLTKMMIHSKR